MYIVIREKRYGTEVRISLDKLAKLMNLRPEEIECAIEPQPTLEAQRTRLAAHRKPAIGTKPSVSSPRRPRVRSR